MKRMFVLLFSLILLISVPVISSAASYTPYSGVTDSTSQVNVLYDYYRNFDEFSYSDEFLIMRNGQYSYILFYAPSLDASEVSYIRYYSDGNYQSSYEFEIGVDTNFSYSFNSFTTVGNIPGTGAMQEHYTSFHSFIVQVLAFVSLILFIFYVFRSHAGELY